MIGGDLCLLTNVFASFYISGVCSDIHSFNNSAPNLNASHKIWQMLLILWWIQLLSSLYLPALCVELWRLTSRNLHSDILAGNQESAKAAVALVLTIVEQ